MNLTTLGIDVGGTKILALALNIGTGRVTARSKVATPSDPAALLNTLERMANNISRQLGEKPGAVGIGVAGLIDVDGVIRTSPNLPGVNNLEVKRPLARRLGLPVALDNDATAAAVAEVRLGVASSVKNCLYVSFGTGIGGGLVINGDVYRGANGFAAEVGHMMIDPNGPLCGCGQRGCWEQLASGTALGRLAQEAYREGRFSVAAERGNNGAELVTGEYVGLQAQAGNAQALALLDEFGLQIARGLANLTNLMDPDMIVVGGGVTDIGDPLLSRVRERFRPLPMGAEHRPQVPIVHGHFGADSGAIGAALLAADLYAPA